MTREQLIADIALRADTTPETAGVVLHTIFDTVKSALRAGDTATLGGLGTWIPASQDAGGLSDVHFQAGRLLAELELLPGDPLPQPEEHDAIPSTILDGADTEARTPVNLEDVVRDVRSSAAGPADGFMKPVRETDPGEEAAGFAISEAESSFDAGTAPAGSATSADLDVRDTVSGVGTGADFDPYEADDDILTIEDHPDNAADDVFGGTSGDQRADDSAYDEFAYDDAAADERMAYDDAAADERMAFDDEAAGQPGNEITAEYGSRDPDDGIGDFPDELPGATLRDDAETSEDKKGSYDADVHGDVLAEHARVPAASAIALESGVANETVAAVPDHANAATFPESGNPHDGAETPPPTANEAAAERQRSRKVQHEMDPITFEKHRDQLYNPPEEKSSRGLLIVAAVVTVLLLAVILYILFGDVGGDPIPERITSLFDTARRILPPAQA